MEEELKRALELWGAETVKKIIAAMPADTGRLKASVKYTIGQEFIDFSMETWGRYLDEGTGKFGPKAKPLGKKSRAGIAMALKMSGWASRKNLNPWAVATNIVKRGGLKPRRFFNDVIERELATLVPHLDDAFVEYIEGRVKIISEQ
jgi:hypothetical protein